jgi:hypothetical protein
MKNQIATKMAISAKNPKRIPKMSPTLPEPGPSLPAFGTWTSGTRKEEEGMKIAECEERVGDKVRSGGGTITLLEIVVLHRIRIQFLSLPLLSFFPFEE